MLCNYSGAIMRRTEERGEDKKKENFSLPTPSSLDPDPHLSRPSSFPLFSLHSHRSSIYIALSSNSIASTFLTFRSLATASNFLSPDFFNTPVRVYKKMSTSTENTTTTTHPSAVPNDNDLPPLVTDRPPRILIAGAGLGGLFLGILLDKAGIPYEIFERSAELRPLGKQPCSLNLLLDVVRPASRG